MSMRVERSSLDQVKKRFEANKKKLEEKQKEYDFEERMKELREEVSSILLDETSSQTELKVAKVWPRLYMSVLLPLLLM